jgi:hypothetical protein
MNRSVYLTIGYICSWYEGNKWQGFLSKSWSKIKTSGIGNNLRCSWNVQD